MAAPVSAARRPDVAAQPAIGPHARQPHRKDCVEVKRLPGLQPGIEQILERVQIAGLALAKKRHAAMKSWAPPRESSGSQFLGEKSAIRVVDLGDIEIKKSPAQAERSQKNTAIATVHTKSASRSPRPQGRRSNSPEELPAVAIFPLDTILASLVSLINADPEVPPELGPTEPRP